MNHENFVRILDGGFTVIDEKDDFDRFEYLCNLSSAIAIPDNALFESFFDSIRAQDDCVLTINIGEGEATFVRKQTSYDNTISQLQAKLDIYEDGEQLNIKIIVEKKNHDGNFFFYSKKGFFNYINTFDELGVAKLFSLERLQSHPKICLEVRGFNGVLESSWLTISAEGNVFSNKDIAYRAKRIESINASIHSTHFSVLKVLPEDFIFEGTGELDSNTHSLFNRLSLVLSISTIFDITDLSTKSFFFKLNGYKSISNTLDIAVLSTNSVQQYLRIYEWIYSSGSIVDKIGLARNIISLHLRKDSSLDLDGDVYESLMSSFKIYERQNIKQYIDVRNKMSDQLADYSKRATTITDNFASGFQKSALTIVTFFSSIVVMRVLGNPTNTIDFAIYSTWITIVFLLVTLLYMIVSRRELKQQKERFKKSYLDFKKRYTDLLTPEDIVRILNEDEEHKADLKFIDAKLKWYTILWWSVIGMISLTTIGYYVYVIMSPLYSSMQNFPSV